jgi:hypothetical protein
MGASSSLGTMISASSMMMLEGESHNPSAPVHQSYRQGCTASPTCPDWVAGTVLGNVTWHGQCWLVIELSSQSV